MGGLLDRLEWKSGLCSSILLKRDTPLEATPTGQYMSGHPQLSFSSFMPGLTKSF